MRPEYFEGTLQLRSPTKELIKYVQKRIESSEIHIAKQAKHKDGIDLFLSSQKFLTTLGKELQKRFTGQLTVSRKLFSRHRQTGKPIYRVNVLFRYHSLKKGQIITYRGEEYEVLFATTKVRAKNKETGKSITINYDQLG